MGKPNLRLFLYFLFTLVKYVELKCWKLVRSGTFYKKWTLRKLLWRRGQLFRPASHLGLVALALLAVVGGTVFGPLPSLAFQTNSSSPDVVSPQTTIQTAVPNDRPRSASIEYSVNSGETLSILAQKYNVSVDTIKWANNLSSDNIAPGQKLIVPPVTGVVHTVTKGETLDSVAKAHGVSNKQILDFPFNDVAENMILQEGQILVIPSGRPVEIANPRPVAKSAPSTSGQTLGISTAGISYQAAGNFYPFGQCTYYVASRRHVGWLDNAGGWYRDALASGYKVGHAPAPGAIMVSYEGNPLGHVSYVESVNPDGSWVVSEMNYAGVRGGGWGRVDRRLIHPGTVFVVGFIY